jgi:two-component sensor histidine kinase
VERIVKARVRSQRWFERFPRGVPVAVFFLTLAVTALAVFAVERAEYDRTRALTAEAVGSIAAGVERRVNSYAAYLRAGGIILSTQPTTNKAEFREFAEQYLTRNGDRGGEGLSWAPRVEADEVQEFERARREEGDPNFTVRPRLAPSQPFALPITYVEPMPPRNRAALGFDMYSEPVRRKAIELAIVSGQPAATGKVMLVQDGPAHRRAGFLIYMPVYDGGDRTRLKGVIATPFNAQSLLREVIREQDAGDYAVALYDGPADHQTLLAEVGSISGRRQAQTVLFSIAGVQYTVAVRPMRTATLSMMSLLTLLFGMLVAALLTLLAAFVGRKASEDRAALLWFQEQASIRNSLTRELNHRVKNTLANVLSIIALTRRRTPDVDSFADSLNGRIRALSATHDLLTQSEWGTTLIRDVVAAELAPYTQDADHEIELQGPDVELAPNDALSLGLAIHELATNAAKYGSLSVISGRLQVHWTMISSELARLEWVERGGPPVASERVRGFGTELIEKIVAHELGRPVELRFEPEGVVCVMVVQVRKPAAFRMRAPRTPDA